MATKKKVSKNMATKKKVSKPIVETKVSNAQKIWDLIHNSPINIFGIPNQVVSQYVTRYEEMEKANPDILYITLKASAVLPALEEVLQKTKLPEKNKSLEIERISSFFTIKMVTKID